MGRYDGIKTTLARLTKSTEHVSTLLRKNRRDKPSRFKTPRILGFNDVKIVRLGAAPSISTKRLSRQVSIEQA